MVGTKCPVVKVVDKHGLPQCVRYIMEVCATRRCSLRPGHAIRLMPRKYVSCELSIAEITFVHDFARNVFQSQQYHAKTVKISNSYFYKSPYRYLHFEMRYEIYIYIYILIDLAEFCTCDMKRETADLLTCESIENNTQVVDYSDFELRIGNRCLNKEKMVVYTSFFENRILTRSGD